MLPPERQKACRNLLKEYFASLVRHVTNRHQAIKNMDRQNRKILQVLLVDLNMDMGVWVWVGGCDVGVGALCLVSAWRSVLWQN